MSRHPLGPWAETMDYSTTDLQKTSSTPEYRDSDDSVAVTWDFYISGLRGLRESKSGVNNGKATSYLPSAASLVKSENTVESFASATTHRNVWNGFQFVGQHGTFSFPVPSDNTMITGPLVVNKAECINTAYLKLAKKLGPGIQGPVVHGEFKESKDMVHHALSAITTKLNNSTQSLSRFVKAVRQKDVRYIGEVIADIHMEFTFGVKPLINDIDNAMATIARKNNSESKYRKISATFVKDGHNLSIIPAFVAMGPSIYLTKSSSINEKVVVKIGGIYDARSRLEPPTGQSHPYGGGIDQVGVTALELLPYSWLAEYFVNIQDFVSASAFPRGFLTNGWMVVIVRTIENNRYTPDNNNTGSPTTLSSISSGQNKRTYFSFNRDPINLDSFTPSLVFSEPDLSQATNIVALALQRLTHVTPRQRWEINGIDNRSRGELINLINNRVITPIGRTK